jgi:ubiquinone/menaquinone biosynthesis C-methylase UbiE
MTQKEVFIASEGDEYYRRNKEKLTVAGPKAANDRVLAAIRALKLAPRAILEIGCANGWRLELLRTTCHASCAGIDPSAEGVADGRAAFPGISLHQGTADALPFDANAFDLVIFGFCLYLCDREHLFRIAAEADRVLNDGGHVAIEDFHSPFPYATPYSHDARITTYKMNYAALFSWNPAYTLVSQTIFDHDGRPEVTEPDHRVSVSVLFKDAQNAFPRNPFTTA